ncbi:MAG TPA: NrfD/PsrC family molybdoenzyme membrane anchor subunit [Myxococcales bacterium]|nr:NrfD/PsrC family molybdoenzyme membrane anchor subunit [Myxococcales bacterium]
MRTPELVQPRPTDGRNIDPALGELRGEGAQQTVATLDEARPFETRPARGEATAETDSYYGLPLLKETVWKWAIPTYFYVGGLAGASAAVAAASLLRRRSLVHIGRAGRLIAVGGAMASAALLIQDLGIRKRFIYMLRVFRPTSPMNLGSWLLTAFGGAATASLLPGRIGDAVSVAAGVLGLPLTSYTGVLLANTAVPLWQQARTTLPPVFVASAAASAAGALEMLPLRPREQRVVRRMAVAGKLAELLNDIALEHEVGRVERVALPLHRGISGALWRAAKACKTASLILSLFPRKPRWGWIAAGVLGNLGALATRFAIFEGGKASARDPHATVEMQRAG